MWIPVYILKDSGVYKCQFVIENFSNDVNNFPNQLKLLKKQFVLTPRGWIRV
jgi:hypothetical protein